MFTINVRGMLSVTTDEDQINLTLMGKIYTKVSLALCCVSCILYKDSILNWKNILNWYNYLRLFMLLLRSHFIVYFGGTFSGFRFPY